MIQTNRTKPTHFCGVCDGGVDQPHGVPIDRWVARYLEEHREFTPEMATQKVTVCSDCEERLRVLADRANRDAADEDNVGEARGELEPILDDLSLDAIYVG